MEPYVDFGGLGVILVLIYFLNTWNNKRKRLRNENFAHKKRR